MGWKSESLGRNSVCTNALGDLDGYLQPMRNFHF